MKHLNFDVYQSPIGEILILADGDQLCFLDFNDNQQRIEKQLVQRYGQYKLNKKTNLLDMQNRLDRYFAGNWNAFDGLPLLTGGTEFQQQVWDSLQTIPVSETISYDQLANAIKNPKAVRAVASANARNPIAVIIPCHRVIGKDGSLRGYAGGIDRKAWLLNHEGFELQGKQTEIQFSA